MTKDLKQIVGKRVIIRTPSGRDNFGKSNGKMIEVGGKCDYIGPNEFMDIPLVITLNRTPFELKSINDILKVE